MRRITQAVGIGAGLLLAAVLAPGQAFAHEEREAVAPVGNGSVPVYRTEGPTLLVCKTDRADFESRIASFPGRAEGGQPRPVRRSARPRGTGICRKP